MRKRDSNFSLLLFTSFRTSLYFSPHLFWHFSTLLITKFHTSFYFFPLLFAPFSLLFCSFFAPFCSSRFETKSLIKNYVAFYTSSQRLSCHGISMVCQRHVPDCHSTCSIVTAPAGSSKNLYDRHSTKSFLFCHLFSVRK